MTPELWMNILINTIIGDLRVEKQREMDKLALIKYCTNNLHNDAMSADYRKEFSKTMSEMEKANIVVLEGMPPPLPEHPVENCGFIFILIKALELAFKMKVNSDHMKQLESRLRFAYYVDYLAMQTHDFDDITTRRLEGVTWSVNWREMHTGYIKGFNCDEVLSNEEIMMIRNNCCTEDADMVGCLVAMLLFGRTGANSVAKTNRGRGIFAKHSAFSVFKHGSSSNTSAAKANSTTVKGRRRSDSAK